MGYGSLDNVRRRIDLNYDCIKEMENLILQQNTDEEKLNLISFIGRMYTEYVTGVYSSSVLEQYVIEIGKNIEVQPLGEGKSGQILIVMSVAGNFGGHTVLVHNWIKWDDENSYSVAFTNMNEKNIPEFLKKVVKESGGEVYCLSGEMVEKAKTLAEVSQRFERIILFTHMEDVIPILAYSRVDWKIPVYFYNHADFRFSYGFSVADVVMNLIDFDVDKSIRYRGVCKEDSVYIQFPGLGVIEKKRINRNKKELREIISEKYGVKEEEKLIVSMGDDFKYENIIGYEFDTYVGDLLEVSPVECSFLIIGAEPGKEKWSRLCERTKGKARALGKLPREEAEQIISVSDLFVTSFPMLASGTLDAEQAGVPSLYLDIIGRYGNGGDNGGAGSIAELIEKSLDVLEGNGDKYLHMPSLKKWEKEEWRRRWREIYKKVDRHSVHSFHPKRLIEKQEYVNCQLMQERAAQMMCEYITNHPLSKRVMEEFWRLDRKYDMGIGYFRMKYLEKKCGELEKQVDKYQQQYQISLRWLEIGRKGGRIDSFLYNQGCRTVAIYGMGYMGEGLAAELSNGLLKVEYGIDRNARQLHSSIPVFEPTDSLERVDIILNTTTVDKSRLLEAMGSNEAKIIQFGDLLNEMDGITLIDEVR